MIAALFEDSQHSASSEGMEDIPALVPVQHQLVESDEVG